MEPEKCSKLKKRNHARCISRKGHTLEIKEKFSSQIILMKHLRGEFLQEQPTQDVIDPSFVSGWPDVCSVLNDPFTKLWERQDLSLDNVHLIYFQWKASKKDLARKTIKAIDDGKIYFRVDLGTFLQMPIFPFLSLVQYDYCVPSIYVCICALFPELVRSNMITVCICLCICALFPELVRFSMINLRPAVFGGQ